MKTFQVLASTLLLLVSSSSALAPYAQANGAQKVLNDANKVPGNNPLVYCADPSDYQLSINNVDISPNPPMAGKNLTVIASGTLAKQIQKGAKINLSVKYRLIKILTQTIDLCEQANVIDQECPIDEGDLKVEKSVELPAVIPPGQYNVLAEVISHQGEPVTCLTANIVFNGDNAFSGLGW